MPPYSEEPDSAGPTEQERTVEAAETLLQESVEHLSQLNAPHLVGVAARKELMYLRPHLQRAVEALEGIERRRGLTDRELNLQHAFKMLLAATRWPG
jgi:hypothetical protein